MSSAILSAPPRVASDVTQSRVTRPPMSKRRRDDSSSLPIEDWWRAKLHAILEDPSNDWTRAKLARRLKASKTSITEIVDGDRQSSSLVAPVSELLAEYGLRAPEVRPPPQGIRGELHRLADVLEIDDVERVVAVAIRMSNASKPRH